MPSESPTKLAQILANKHGQLHPSDTLSEAGAKMRSMHAGSLPVTEGRRIIGIVEGGEPDKQATARGHDPKDWTVGEVMTQEAIYCFEGDDRAEARAKMEAHGLPSLPVVDEQLQIVGVVTREDVAG